MSSLVHVNSKAGYNDCVMNNPGNSEKKTVLCHLSFDDSESAFSLLRESGAGSVSDSIYFRELLRLHNIHGASFTLYLLNKDAMDGLDSRIYRELSDNSSWLKFSYHGNDGDIGSPAFTENYSECIRRIVSLIGKESLPDILRVHRFNVDSRTAGFLKSNGIRILLAADDGRPVASLDEKGRAVLADAGETYSEGLAYWRTDIRLERDNWFEKYRKWRAGKSGHLVVFSHEQLVSNDAARLAALIRRLETILENLESEYGIIYL